MENGNMDMNDANNEKKFPIEIPSVVGPSIYEVYTDARLFITHLYVNGIKRKLDNAEGFGLMATPNYTLNGATGYKNKKVINGYLHAGKNHVKVVFEPSPVLAQAKEQGAEELVIKEMFAHVAVIRGRLTDSSLGVPSAELDELITQAADKIDVLQHWHMDNFTLEQINGDIVVSREFDLDANDKAIQSTINDCELSISSSNNYNAILKLNDVPVKEIEENVSRNKEDFKVLLKNGTNKFSLEVQPPASEGALKKLFSKNKKSDEEMYLRVTLNTDIEEGINAINFPDEHKRVGFGDFFDRVDIPLAYFKIDGVGEFVEEFEFKL